MQAPVEIGNNLIPILVWLTIMYKQLTPGTISQATFKELEFDELAMNTNSWLELCTVISDAVRLNVNKSGW